VTGFGPPRAAVDGVTTAAARVYFRQPPHVEGDPVETEVEFVARPEVCAIGSPGPPVPPGGGGESSV
jgi:hypothetical protein